jgi:hypothetical protein
MASTVEKLPDSALYFRILEAQSISPGSFQPIVSYLVITRARGSTSFPRGRAICNRLLLSEVRLPL